MGLPANIPRLNWIRDKKAPRPKTGVDRDTWNEIANYQDDLFDLLTEGHTTAGEHDDPAVAKAEGYVLGTTAYAFVDPNCIITTTFTLARSQGTISSIAKQSQGRYRVTLSTALVQPYFPVVRAVFRTTIDVVPGGCVDLGQAMHQPEITIISGTQFDVTLRNVGGTELGRDTVLWVHGETA